MKAAHWVVLGAGAAAAAWFASRVIGGGQTGGFNAPAAQPAPLDELARLADPHPDHPLFCQPGQHHAGYVYTPHRFPVVTGGEITAAIHRGFASMRVPAASDVQWLIAPPSEVAF